MAVTKAVLIAENERLASLVIAWEKVCIALLEINDGIYFTDPDSKAFHADMTDRLHYSVRVLQELTGPLDSPTLEQSLLQEESYGKSAPDGA